MKITYWYFHFCTLGYLFQNPWTLILCLYKKSHSLGMFLMFFSAQYSLEGEFDYVNMANVEIFFGISMVWQLSLHLIKCSRCLWFFQFSSQVLFGVSFLFSFLQKLYVFFKKIHNWLLHFFLLLWHEFDDFKNFLSKCCFEIVLLSFIVEETFCYFKFYLQLLFIALLLQVKERNFKVGTSQSRII